MEKLFQIIAIIAVGTISIVLWAFATILPIMLAAFIFLATLNLFHRIF